MAAPFRIQEQAQEQEAALTRASMCTCWKFQQHPCAPKCWPQDTAEGELSTKAGRPGHVMVQAAGSYLQQCELRQQGRSAVKGLLDDSAEHDLQVSHTSLELGKVLKPARRLHVQNVLVALRCPQHVQQLLE